MRRMLCLLLAVILMAGLVQPVASQASVPPPNWYHPTLAQAKTALKGKSVGPNKYTSYGKATITGWTTSGKYTKAVVKTVYFNPALAMASSGNQMVPQSWYNPFSWDWGHILGSTWNAIWNNCAKGAVKGSVGGVTTDVAIKLINRGASLYVGPYGYLVLGISGCFATLIFGD